MQRFLTDSPWDDDAVMERLQEYLAPRLEHPGAVWVLDGSDFPKQGRKSAGVARQYCGRLGKVANCQAGVFLACVSPLGRAWWTSAFTCRRDGSGTRTAARRWSSRGERGYRSKTELALEMLERAVALGHLGAGWVAADDAIGMSRPSATDWQPRECTTFWTFQRTLRCGRWSLSGQSPYQGRGAPRKPSLRGRTAPVHGAESGGRPG